MEYAGYVAVPEDKIELWRTQIRRAWQKSAEKWPDEYKDIEIDRLATHGASGIWHFCQKEIREQLKIPHSEVIERVRQRRVVRKIGNVWYFEVRTRPRR